MKRFFYAVIAVLALSSCTLDDDDPNFNYVALNIVEAELPESFNLNETYDIKVTYQTSNDCSFFEGFDVVREDETVRRVVALGRELIDEDNCKEETVLVTEMFRFIVLYNQPYTFRFWQGENADGENEYLEVEVPVNN